MSPQHFTPLKTYYQIATTYPTEKMSKWVAVAQIATLVFQISRMTTAQEASCGPLDEWSNYKEVRSDHPVNIPIWQVRAANIAFAAFLTTERNVPFTVELSGEGGNQTLSVYTKEGFDTFTTDWRYTYSVAIPWPGAIPITHEIPIWARDRDFNNTQNQVTFSIDMPTIVTLRSTIYGDTREFADYKIDLLLNPPVVPGTYQMIVTAQDGNFTTTVPVTLIVTEAECKPSKQDPVFGKAGANVNFYEAVISSFPSSGDLLELNGGEIEAFHPDPLCRIDISVESDFLEINSEGQIVFSRTIPLEEWKQIKSTTIVQIVATEKVSGTMKRVPLIICVDFPEASGQKSAMIPPSP